MAQEQLCKASVASGLKNMSWQEFSGLTVGCSNINYNDNISESRAGYGGVGAYAPLATETYALHRTTGCQVLPTVGSMLVLNFAEVIQVTEDYYAPGSLGSFNLQVTIKVANHQIEDWPVGQWEMIIITMNSGVFVNERGTSSTFLSLLTKQDVLDSLTQTPYTNFEVNRLVGGASFMDRVRSGLHWIHSKLPAAKQFLGHIPHPIAQTAHNVLGALGYGMSGGGVPAGQPSAGDPLRAGPRHKNQ